MRVQITRDVDPDTLADQLKTALGMDVALSVRNPGQNDTKGEPLPGVIVLLDANTGEPLPDQDLKKIAAVLTAHVPPQPKPAPAKALADALRSGTNLADLRAALVTYADTLVDRENAARQRRQRGRG